MLIPSLLHSHEQTPLSRILIEKKTNINNTKKVENVG